MRFMLRLTVVRLMIAAALFCALNPVTSRAADTPHAIVGTWKLNVSKSKYDPGPPPRSLTRTYVATEQGLKLNYDGADADGNPTVGTHIIKLDGKSYPEPDAPDYDTASSKRIDPFTIRVEQSKNGRVVATLTYVVAKDRQHMTLTKKGVDAKGVKFDVVAVYDRV